MSRYIDLDKLLEYEYMECLTISDCREVKKLGIEYCNKYCTIRDECFLFWANDNIEDVTPVIHAKWEGAETIQLEVKDAQGIFIGKDKIGFKFNQRAGTCSNCHSFQLIGKYCPNCGAKMKGAI